MTVGAHAWRRWVLVITAACAAAFEARCGARTGLPLPEVCGKPGSVRHCENTCGEGEEVCQDGYWGTCDVPPATRTCSNTCGSGEQTCIDDAWQPCSVPVATRTCPSLCGPGTETCKDDVWSPCNAPLPGPPTLPATVRSAPPNNPDFHAMCCFGGADPGIVASTLGPDGKPVYAGDPVNGTLTTHGTTDFNEWYNTGPNTQSMTMNLTFVPQAGMPGINQFDNEAFFPFGPEADCTAEAHGRILYTGGESYDFASDDDLWVFINRRLALDLGGLHASMPGTINLDQMAGQLGIVQGQMFALDIFYANREPSGAVLEMSIPQSDLWSCP